MTAKTVAKSRILKAVHETASDLNAAGFIDIRRMREYDALCLAPIPAYSRQRIRALRQRHKLSQAVLAAVLNTSLSTVREMTPCEILRCLERSPMVLVPRSRRA